MVSAHAIGVVAGSGLILHPLLTKVHRTCSFEEMGVPYAPTVRGHAGKFLMGDCGDTPVVLQCGRLHFHEGCDYDAVTAGVDAMQRSGVSAIVFTNAAGGLRPGMAPGTLMAVRRLCAFTRYARWGSGPDVLEAGFLVPGCSAEGDYMWVHGPCYETRAEIAAMQAMGAGAVGMSTFPEMHRCEVLGIRAGAVSCITNNCCASSPVAHGAVIAAAAASSAKLIEVLRKALPTLAESVGTG